MLYTFETHTHRFAVGRDRRPSGPEQPLSASFRNYSSKAKFDVLCLTQPHSMSFGAG